MKNIKREKKMLFMYRKYLIRVRRMLRKKVNLIHGDESFKIMNFHEHIRLFFIDFLKWR